jgi:hypothetical protein
MLVCVELASYTIIVGIPLRYNIGSKFIIYY